jgi:hypothetical protein
MPDNVVLVHYDDSGNSVDTETLRDRPSFVIHHRIGDMVFFNLDLSLAEIFIYAGVNREKGQIFRAVC